MRNALVDHLRGLAGEFSRPVEPSQIRGMLDMSGQPRESLGVVVSGEDLGDHAGNTGRILVDVRLVCSVWSHIDEDADGILCDTLAEDVFMGVLSMDWRNHMPYGWSCAWNGNWTIGESELEASWRRKTLMAVLPLVRNVR